MVSRAVLLDRHAVALERIEAAQVRTVAAAYNQARRELLDKLISQWRGNELMTPADAARMLRQSGLLQQIDARLQALERELGVNLQGIVNSSTELALEQMRQELSLLPPSLRPDNMLQFGTINTSMVERFVPVAFQDVQLGTRSLSLTLQREMQTGLLQGESFPTMVARLLKATPGDVASPWRRGELSAELATRRLVITAENGAKHAAIGELQNDIPEVQKQAIAVIGENTTDTCLRVHGQIQPNDQPFTLTGTPRFADEMMFPSFHWRCRTSIALYHPIFERHGLTTANMRKSAEAQLSKGSSGKGTVI